jgi:hypothetical protein
MKGSNTGRLREFMACSEVIDVQLIRCHFTILFVEFIAVLNESIRI